MTPNVITVFAIIFVSSGLALGALILFVKIFFPAAIESAVGEAIKHPFELQKQEYQHKLDLQKQELRQEFEERWNALTRKDRFRLASLDKRLAAHQKAFALVRRMFAFLYEEDRNIRHAIAQECEVFLDENTLYLNNEARNRIWKALSEFSYFYQHLNAIESDAGDEAKKQEHHKEIAQVVELFASLPSFIVKVTDEEANEDFDYRLKAVPLANKEEVAAIEKKKSKKKP